MKEDTPSRTAKVIAASTILLYHSGERVLVPESAVRICKLFLSSTWGDRTFARSAEFFLTRCMWRLVERFTLPGIVRHYWHRKNVIENECRKALREGYKRVVVLGGGFDTLAIRLASEFVGVNLIEFDHPATQNRKQASLAQSGAPENINFIPLDLGSDPKSWPAFPVESVVIAEGLLMYFNEERVKEILCWAGSSGKARFIGTYMERVEDTPMGFRPRSALIDWWLKHSKEPFLWQRDPETIEQLAEELRYKILDHVKAIDMRALISEKLPETSLEGENIFVFENE